MPSKLIKTDTELELAPGASIKRKWNNAAPHDAVWSANAIPIPPGDNGSGYNADVRLRVTDLSRRLLQIEKKDSPKDQTTQIDLEHEIHCTVKNVGSQPARFRIYYTAVW